MAEKIICFGLVTYSLGTFWSRALIEVGMVIILLGWLGKMAWERKWMFIRLPNLDYALIAFGLAMVISCITAFDKGEGFEELHRSAFKIFTFYLILNNIKNIKQINNLINVLFFSAILAAIYGWVQHFMGLIRITGNFSNCMTYTEVMMVISIIAIAFTIEEKNNIRKSFYFLTAMFTSIAFLFTFTRGAWIGWLVAVCCLGILKEKKIVILLLIFVFLSSVFLPGMTDRVQSIVDLQEQSNSERLKLWESSISMIRDYPITGIGLGNFIILYPNKYALSTATQKELGHAHNIFLQVGAETGLLGIIGFIWLYFIIFRENWKRFQGGEDDNLRGLSLGVLCAWIAFLIHGFTEFNFFDYSSSRLLWTFFALNVLVGKIRSPLTNFN